MDVYREPASPFVADFVGRVNVWPVVAEAGGVRLGAMRFDCDHTLAAGTTARLYLRPEDVRAHPPGLGLEAPHAFDSVIEKIEFLGAYCLVQVRAAALDGHPLAMVLALNFLAEHRLTPGARLPVALRPERMRVFA
jgi:iron(III) transport system ATP-binding protein